MELWLIAVMFAATALSFKAFNRRYAPARTEFDWLSRDAAEVDRYIKDPRCGFRCSSGLWMDLLGAAGRHADMQRLAIVPRDALGLTIIDSWSGFGQRTTASGNVVIENVH